MVVWTRVSSRSYSATGTWVSSFWRTRAWLAARCRITPAVVIWPGALIQQLPTVLDGDVNGRLLKPNVLSRRPSGTDHGSSSHLTFQEVLCLTYDIVRREPAHLIQEEHGHSSATVTDWGMFCRETMLVYMEGWSEKIGSPNKTVEIDESRVTRTEPLTTPLLSSMKREITPTPFSRSGVTSRRTLNPTRGRRTTYIISLITCSRQGAKLKVYTSSRNSCTLSRARICRRVLRTPHYPHWSESHCQWFPVSWHLLFKETEHVRCTLPSAVQFPLSNRRYTNSTEMTLPRMTAARRQFLPSFLKPVRILM